VNKLFVFFSTFLDNEYTRSGGEIRLTKFAEFLKTKGYNCLTLKKKSFQTGNNIYLYFLLNLTLYPLISTYFFLKILRKSKNSSYLVLIPFTHFGNDLLLGSLLKAILRILLSKRILLIVYEQLPISFYRSLPAYKRRFIDDLMIFNEKIGITFAKNFADKIFILSNLDIKFFGLSKNYFLTTNSLLLKEIESINRVRKRDLHERDIDFLYVARFVREKGVYDLDKILEYINRVSHRKVSVVIVGRGPEFGRIKKEVERLKFKLDKVLVTFKGSVSDAEKYNLMSRSKILLYPSYADSFPYVILEARVFGLHIVAYALPSLLEKWKNGVTFVKIGSFHELANTAMQKLKEIEEGLVTLTYHHPEITLEEIFINEIKEIFTSVT